jgi:hypothetical protein
MATFEDYLLDLSYVLGETSVPTSGIDDRKRFINIVRRDICNRRPWKWATKWGQSVSLTDGSGSLPSDYREGGMVEVRVDKNVFEQISYSDQSKYEADAYVYWVTGNQVDGFKINTNQDLASVDVSYATQCVNLSALADQCPIPLTEPVVKGALVYIRKSENPMADTQSEELEYEKAISKLNRIDMQGNPKRRMISLSETRNRRLGE